MKAVVATFNQEKALGTFSVIVKLHRLIVYSTSRDMTHRGLASPLLDAPHVLLDVLLRQNHSDAASYVCKVLLLARRRWRFYTGQYYGILNIVDKPFN